MDALEAISPIDGRYRRYTEPLAKIFSEAGLIQYRITVEVEYLIALSEHSEVGIRKFSLNEKRMLRELCNLSLSQIQVIKTIEMGGHPHVQKTNHDVKAIEYFIKERLRETSLCDSLEWIHFALTSEDTNNIAYALMLSDGIERVIFLKIRSLLGKLEDFSRKYKSVPMLARTHGQPASPTTAGKEFKVFAKRLERQMKQLQNFRILVKLNGATGNYNAHHVACPDVDWVDFARNFIENFNRERFLKLEFNLYTTQIEPHDTYAELFDNLRRLNTLLIDFCQDMWRYISDGWLEQKPTEGEVGSSTMPHKVNPSDFETAEGNLGLANMFFDFFSEKLPISRLQRHLSDSTVIRNFGVALGHSLIAYECILKGLDKITINEEEIIQVLENHPEIIAEAIQTILRREGISTPYEKLKALTRGRRVILEDIRKFIDELDVSDEVKAELKQITSTNYTGIASYLAGM